MFNIKKYDFSKKLSKKDKDLIKKVYLDGNHIGYEDGYNDGQESGYNEGYDSGYLERTKEEILEKEYRDTVIYKIINEIGYSNIIKLQEKTDYHICYGDEINFPEMLKAIKVILES